MGFDVSLLARRGRDILAGFTAGQKVVTVLAVIGLLVGGVLFSSWASKPSMVPLYSNLESSDASAITEKLTAGSTPYELADGGKTILVPQQDVYQLRIDMSSEGLPTGGTSGYALLDKQSITTSEFQQQVQYQRALEGELTNTITVIDGVESAVVHLVVPKESVFAAETPKPSASVLIKTAPEKPLSGEQVSSIVHLVSSSVAGLDTKDVTVTDAAGRMLKAPGQVGTSGGGGDMRSQQTADYEQAMSDAVQKMLEPVVGVGGAVVKVTADLDFDQRQTKTERYVAEPNTPPLSSSTTKETYAGAGTPGAGILGPDNNGVPIAPGTGESSYVRESNTQDNAVGKVVEESVATPGAVKRLSVAVLLDENAAGAVDMNKVEALVTTAAGVQADRGDTVTVDALGFDDTAAENAEKELKEAAAAARKAELISLGKTVLAVVLFGIFLLLAIWRSKKRESTVLLASEERLELEEARRTLAALESRASERSEQLAIEKSTAPSPDELARVSLRDDIGDLVERQPDEVAQLLRGWLADRRS